ncbi:MAG: crossover junction endodeoxyribonuclease RuvC [Candidatus Colwellbacteria bacterium]|nr:crossover junction endodeoxyribonuclease RuvC [Candidatus Colwellbacteria bacterium]MBI3273834.1 crossover junction endodeoxyribonuclease RuvC [Candidatus Colwellbacteria bacterium]
MTILGIDPGTTRTGYGVIEKGKRLKLLSYGVIETHGGQEGLVELDKKLTGVIKKYRPRIAGVEKLYFSKNKKTAIAVAQARGVIILSLNRHKVDAMEFDPTNIKSFVTGNGRSDKRTVAKFVCLTLGLREVNGPDDAADALAVAIRTSFEKID